jgi:uncharacterized membrane protein YeaQ/YmgE (transglycosylase-associated protein family)
MLDFICWLLIGLVVGLLGRMLVPGRQPRGLVMTVVMGLAGAVVGGFVAALAFSTNQVAAGVQVAGLLLSTIGAVAVLALYVAHAQCGPTS